MQKKKNADLQQDGILSSSYADWVSLGNSLRALIPDKAPATAVLWLPSASAPAPQPLVKGLHVTVTNGVADVTVANRMTAFPASPSVAGEATTVCVRVGVRGCCREKQRDLEILNPLWISGRPDIKEIYCGSVSACSETIAALYSAEQRRGWNNQRGSGWRNEPSSLQAPNNSVYTALTFLTCGRMFLALIIGIRKMSTTTGI